MDYEKLQKEATQQGIYFYEEPMETKVKGLYADNVICINRNLTSNTEKSCILAEEFGHYHTSAGDSLDQTKLVNRKQEYRARNWSYEKLIPLSALVEACKDGVQNRYELAEFLGVTEDFLGSALKRYQEKYGLFVTVGDYTICFEPLQILEISEY